MIHLAPMGKPTIRDAVRNSEEDPTLPSGRRRVLIVDDDPALARVLRSSLAEQYDVRAVTSGRAALEVLSRDPHFDVLVVDLMMPEINGMDLFEQISEHHAELACRIIFITGGAFTTRAREFLQRVKNPQLDKPFALDTLQRLIRSQIDGRMASA